MGQLGVFDAERRLAAISAKGDPLEMIARVVPFESFRADAGEGEEERRRPQTDRRHRDVFGLWCCNRFTTCPTNRSSITCASRIAFRTARRSSPRLREGSISSWQ